MTSKIFSIVLTLCLLLANSFYQIILSCGYYEEDGYGPDYGYSFILSQRMLDNDPLSPFFLMYNSYMAENVFVGVDSAGANKYEIVNHFDDRQENIDEWKKYFKDASEADIDEAIYSLGNAGLSQLEMHMQLKTPLPKDFPVKNKVIQQIIKRKDYDWLTYMKYAFKCLNYVGQDYNSYNYYWSDREELLPFKDCNTLISQAKSLIIKTKNKNLQQRYAFQICRLAHYFSVINNTSEEEIVETTTENTFISQFESTTEDTALFATAVDSAMVATDYVTAAPSFVQEDEFVKSGKKEFVQIANEGIAVFGKYLENSESSMVKEWARAHYAPLLYFMKQPEMAALENSRAFANCPSKRRAAKTAMPYDTSYVNKLINHKRFKTKREELDLRALTALDHVESTVDDIIYIGQKEPAHFMIPVLLIRELKKFENEFNQSESRFAYSDDESGTSESEKANLDAYLSQLNSDASKLLNFCANVNASRDKRYAFIYQLIAGYLAYHTGKFAESEKYYTNALNSAGSQLQKDQIRLLVFMTKIAGQKEPGAEFESLVLKEMKWIDTCKVLKDVAYNAKLTAMINLQQVYEKQPIMKLFLNSWVSIPNYTSCPDLDVLEEVDTYLKSNAHSPLQTYLSTQMGISIDEIYEIKGTLALAEGDFKKAINLFEAVKDEGKIGSTNGDPFKTNFSDCIYCNENNTDFVISKLEYAKEMLSLTMKEAAGKSNFDIYLKLANAYYNTSYYGPNYNLLDYDRSTSGGYSKYDIGRDISYTDCKKAEQYYLKASTSTKNHSQKALCIYLAAKCGQNTDYAIAQIGDLDYMDESAEQEYKSSNRDKYFKLVSTDYADTWVHQYAKERCSYYFNYCK